MRQFFSWRVWAAFAAVIALALLWWAVAPDAGVKGSGPAGPALRNVQFVSLVYSIEPSPGFAITDGVVSGSADFVLDGQRTMHVVAGTPGDIECAEMTEIGRCVVLADLLGDAVVWFTLQPVQTGLKVDAPPIVELLEDGIARLENGWLVPYDSAVDRKCNDETETLAEFVRDQGSGSHTVIDVARQRITQVVCANATPDTTTTTTVPPFTVVTDPALVDVTSTVPGEISEDVPETVPVP
jgi:hypothetical protein